MLLCTKVLQKSIWKHDLDVKMCDIGNTWIQKQENKYGLQSVTVGAIDGHDVKLSLFGHYMASSPAELDGGKYLQVTLQLHWNTTHVLEWMILHIFEKKRTRMATNNTDLVAYVSDALYIHTTLDKELDMMNGECGLTDLLELSTMYLGSDYLPIWY